MKLRRATLTTLGLLCGSALAQTYPSPTVQNLTVLGTQTGGGVTGGNQSTATVTATGGTTARALADWVADQDNAIGFGADPSGMTDSSAAINAAASALRYGTLPNVHLPAGTYLVNNALNIGSASQSQCLIGDGFGTILHVTSAFNAAADGVINLSTNSQTQQPCVKGIQIVFDQPTDIITTASATAANGATQVTVASASGIVVGDIIFDATRRSVVSQIFPPTSVTNATVTAIAGNTLTLSSALIGAGIVSGDSLHFGPSRAMFKTLAQGCSTTAGGTGCKYPWAIKSAAGQQVYIDNVIITGAWDGVYIRGSTFHIGTLSVGALDQGINIDQCFNFPQMDTFQFYSFGFNDSNQAAMQAVFYDGITIAATLGQTDGLSANSFQSWTGSLILTSAWSWGTFMKMELDGNNANLVIQSSAGGAGFVEVANFYSTKGAQTVGNSIYFAPGAAGFVALINNAYMATATPYNHAVVVTGQASALLFNNSYFWDGLQSLSNNFFWVGSGDTLSVSNSLLHASPGRTDTYISQQAGSILKLVGNSFTAAPGSGATAAAVSDNAANVLSANSWNGWAVTGVTAAATGSYDVPTLKNVNAPLSLKAYTVAALPACGASNTGATVVVSNQSGTPTYGGALTGGGALSWPAFCNGTSWLAH